MINQKINLQDEKNSLLKMMYHTLDNQELNEEMELNPIWRQLFEGVATLNTQARFLIERNLSNIYYSWLSKVSKRTVSPKPAKTILRFLDAHKCLASSININNTVFYSQPTGPDKNKIAWKVQRDDKLTPLEIVEIIQGKNAKQLEVKFNYYGKNKKETINELNLMINADGVESFTWLEWFFSAEINFVNLQKNAENSLGNNVSLSIPINNKFENKDEVSNIFFDFYKFQKRFSIIKLNFSNEINLFENANFSVFFENNKATPNNQIKDLIAVNCFCIENNFSLELDPLMLSKNQNRIELSMLNNKDKIARLINVERVMVYSGNKSFQLHEKHDGHLHKTSYQCRKSNFMSHSAMELLIEGELQTPSTLSVKANVCQENYPHTYLNKNHLLEIPKNLPAGLTAVILQKPTVYEHEPDSSRYESLWNDVFSLNEIPIDKISLQKQIDFYAGDDVDKTAIQIEEVYVDQKSLVKNGVMVDLWLVSVKARCKENSEILNHYLFGLLLKHYFDFLAPIGLEVLLNFQELNSNKSWSFT